MDTGGRGVRTGADARRQPAVTVLDRQVRALERQANRAAAYEPHADWWRFAVSVSQPPDTRLHMRGGFLYSNPYMGYGYGGGRWRIEPRSFDLSDVAVTGESVTFAHSYWYLGWVVVHQVTYPDYTPSRPIWVAASDEVATAAEAEEGALDWLHVAWSYAWENGIVLGVVVLRNNGDTGQPNQFQPIDAVNRGRSYLWRRDTKPRWSC